MTVETEKQPVTEMESAQTIEQPKADAAPVVASAETPLVETPVVEAPAAEPGIKETLLETVSKELSAETAPKPEAPAAPETEKKPEAEAAKSDGEPAPAKPAPLPPIEYKYEAPEGFEINDERKGEFHTALDAFRANPAEGIQPLLELHSKAVVEAINKVRGDQTQLFNNTLVDWEKQIMADPEIGGAGYETAKRAVARVRDAAVPAKDLPDFEHFLRVTGAGSHPAFWRMLHNLAAYVDEPNDIPTNILPPKNIGKAPPGAKRVDNFYDHPRGNMDS